MQLDSGAIIAGKYRLEHPLSAGGMGSVWVAQHVQLGTHVAVKFMGTAYAGAPAFRARFEREARAAAHLRSPHVVQVHDFGFEQGVPYLVMELLRGEDLSKRLSRVRRLPLAETQRLLVQAGKALRSVHEAGLVHRDLKPANLFLARVDGEDEDLLKLIDFGIAKETAPKLVTEASTTGEVMGSPHYMSPEQLRADRDIDARSDLWAMGVILFRMVTGYLPFPGDVLAQVMTKILVEPIPSARQLAPDLPAAIDAFFARALARERAHRFQNVREMVEEFGRASGVTAVFSSSGVGGSSPFGWAAAGGPGVTGAVGGAVAAGTAGVAAAGTGAPGGYGGYGGPSYPAAPAQVPVGGDGKTAVGPEPSPGTLTDAVHVAGPSRQRSRGARAAWIAAGSVGIAAVGLGLGVMLRRMMEAPGEPGGEASVAAEANPGATASAEAAGEGTQAAAATKVEAPAATSIAATGTGTGAAIAPVPEVAPGAPGDTAAAASALPERAQPAPAPSPGTSSARPSPGETPTAAPTPRQEEPRTTPERPRMAPSAGRGAPPGSTGPARGDSKNQPDWGF
ncbi:protein kinase domain-containing protein [Sorangium sp. So ce131]|uniref:serine/threonine-protein kinase n=1 Tax=Sorangium sp. So ce131 TaxID=3133282 RepID=UPI003F622FE5